MTVQAYYLPGSVDEAVSLRVEHGPSRLKQRLGGAEQSRATFKPPFRHADRRRNREPQPACENLEADLEGDGDVDGFDFLTFANCYNGSGRAPLCP